MRTDCTIRYNDLLMFFFLIPLSLQGFRNFLPRKRQALKIKDLLISCLIWINWIHGIYVTRAPIEVTLISQMLLKFYLNIKLNTWCIWHENVYNFNPSHHRYDIYSNLSLYVYLCEDMTMKWENMPIIDKNPEKF